MTDTRPPRGLASLLAWFRDAWEADYPADPAIHTRGVWHDREASSALGSPALAPGFSDYLVGSPRATDHDTRVDTWTTDATFRRPTHAVLARMAGTDPDSDGAFAARWLFRLACMGFDVTTAADGVMPPQVAPMYTLRVLERAWLWWRPAPEARTEAA